MSPDPTDVRIDVLVTEGHPDVLAAIQAVLEAEGYQTEGTSNAREALAVLSRPGRPGVLLLDETLPEMERARLLRFIRQRPALRALPVVLLTSGATVRPRDVQAVLRKPFTLTQLCAVVKAHVGKSAARALPAAAPALYRLGASRA